MIELTEKDKRRFWSKVDKSPGFGPWGDCWKWTACTNNKSGGYGRFPVRRDGRRHNLGAHVVSYELANGPVPGGLYVLHRCDFRRCVNPAHLFPGSSAANTHDMFGKGRDKYAAKKRADGEVVGVRCRLAEVAIAKGVALSQLQRTPGLPSGVVQRMWYDRGAYLDLATLGKLADVLQVEPGELLARAP